MRIYAIASSMVLAMCFTFAAPSPMAIQGDDLSQLSVPDYVIYELYFRKVAFFNNLANKYENDLLKSNEMRNVIARELGISETEKAILTQISLQCIQEAGALDAKADNIIQRYHAKFSGGIIDNSGALPEIPPELNALQLSRNEVFAKYRRQLRDQVGEVRFQDIDKLINAKILSDIQIKKAK